MLQLWASSPASAGADARTRDGAVYALALGSNFGAFTLTFSASLAGLLWRQILAQNWDWREAVGKNLAMVSIAQEGKPKIWMVVEASPLLLPSLGAPSPSPPSVPPCLRASTPDSSQGGCLASQSRQSPRPDSV